MKRWVISLLGVVLVAAVSQWSTRSTAGRCALDGVRIEPILSVDVTYATEPATTLRYCCVHCAITDLSRRGTVAEILVHDEVTGEASTAQSAYYVQEEGGSAAPVHVYTHWADALRHVETLSGLAIKNPFRAWLPSPSENAPQEPDPGR